MQHSIKTAAVAVLAVAAPGMAFSNMLGLENSLSELTGQANGILNEIGAVPEIKGGILPTDKGALKGVFASLGEFVDELGLTSAGLGKLAPITGAAGAERDGAERVVDSVSELLGSQGSIIDALAANADVFKRGLVDELGLDEILGPILQNVDVVTVLTGDGGLLGERDLGDVGGVVGSATGIDVANTPVLSLLKDLEKQTTELQERLEEVFGDAAPGAFDVLFPDILAKVESAIGTFSPAGRQTKRDSKLRNRAALANAV